MNVDFKKMNLQRCNCDVPFKPKTYYKIYNDGGHYVATKLINSKVKHSSKVVYEKTQLDKLFDYLYLQGIKENYNKNDLKAFIKNEIVNTYSFADEIKDLDKYIEEKSKSKINNFYKRVKRFKRKANLNKWNYFCTFTFDDKKHTVESFKKSLRKCLSNLHTRRGWRYMGVFELGEKNERLHFHCIMFIPDGQMVGNIAELNEYSTRLKTTKLRHANDFFDERFGRSDFAPIESTEMTIVYILKYLQKDNEKIVYSRGIASEICKVIENKDIACEFVDFVYKFVLFDDVISWEKDIMHYTYKQASFLIPYAKITFD